MLHLLQHFSKIFKTIYKLTTLSIMLAILGLIFIWSMYVLFFVPPNNFPSESYIDVPQGSTLTAIAESFKQKGIIHSQDVFLLVAKAIGKQDELKSGMYYFENPKDMVQVLLAVIRGEHNLPTHKITFFEGEAIYTFAKQAASKFENITEQQFLDAAAGKEGYLFPDTYLFPYSSTAKDIVKSMERNFDKQIKPLEAQILTSGRSLDDIVTMASIVETEAGVASYEVKKNVAGILYKRLELGMLLQADAVFSYIVQEHLPRVLYRHLAIDSPYNLYKYTGLPPTPISSPGIDSIKAAIDYNKTSYLFYLTGNDGKFYYAQTLYGHEKNRRNYLSY